MLRIIKRNTTYVVFLFCAVVQVLLIKRQTKNHPHIGWFSVWCTRKDPYATHPDFLTASGSVLSPKNSTLYCFLHGSSLLEVQVLLIKKQTKNHPHIGWFSCLVHQKGPVCYASGFPHRKRFGTLT